MELHLKNTGNIKLCLRATWILSSPPFLVRAKKPLPIHSPICARECAGQERSKCYCSGPEIMHEGDPSFPPRDTSLHFGSLRPPPHLSPFLLLLPILLLSEAVVDGIMEMRQLHINLVETTLGKETTWKMEGKKGGRKPEEEEKNPRKTMSKHTLGFSLKVTFCERTNT